MKTLLEKYNTWVDTLTVFDEERIFIWLGPAGIGDKISCLPAFKHLKKINPNKKIVLYVEPLNIDLWKCCRYIDAVIPEGYVKGDGALNIRPIDIGRKAFWSFFEHHQKHISKSNIEQICDVEYTDDIPLEYEISTYDYDLPKIDEYKSELIEKSKGKKIVAISPAYTMYSRMWSIKSWKRLTDLLQKNGYFVVALGGQNDLEIKNVDLDMCGEYPFRIIPKLLDLFHSVVTLNSGMLHLASVNQDVKIVYVSVGQFPPELIAPYRRGKLFHNMEVIDHNCNLKQTCFEGHISEKLLRPTMYNFLDHYKHETGADYPEDKIELMKKYCCWHYCAKVLNKYSCSDLITPEEVMERI